MSSDKLQALRRLIKLMKKRTAKKAGDSVYRKGAELSGMSGYLPDMKDGNNMSAQRKKLNNAKPYDRIEKDK